MCTGFDPPQRIEYELLMLGKGANISSKLRDSTDFLVVGDYPGDLPAVKKVFEGKEEKKVKVLNFFEFKRMFL